MRIKKHFLVTIILFLLFVPNVKADQGDLRYEITNLEVTEKTLTISGYAFIHQTNNYITVYKKNSDGTTNYNSVKASNGGQKIRIKIENEDDTTEYKIYDENDGLVFKEDISDNDGYPHYNFYYEHYDQTGTIDFIGDYNNAERNCHGLNSQNKTCYYYEDIYFTYTFNLNDIKEIGKNLKFYISVTNKDYQKLKGNGKWVTAAIGVTEGAITANKNSPIKITTGSNATVTAIVQYGMYQKIDNNVSYGDKSMVPFNCQEEDRKLTIFRDKYTLGYKKPFKHEFDDEDLKFLNGTYAPGKIAVCVGNKSNNNSFRYNNCSKKDSDGYCIKCNSTNSKLLAVYASWVKPTAALKIQINNDKKCDASNPTNTTTKCNDSKEISSECKQLTINKTQGEYQATSEVSITEKGVLNNVLTPTTIYAGGGFNLGMIYYNTISWEIKSLTCYKNGVKVSEGNCTNIINNEIASKIKDVGDIENDIKVDAEYDNEKLNMKVKCDKTADLNNKLITTICTIFLPEANIEEYTGEVDYTSEDGNGIQNKYYTSTKDSGTKKIQFTITGLNILDEGQEKKDTSGTNQYWAGDWNVETSETDDNNCSINVYSLLETSEGKYIPIYRPIDLNNPFPNRNAGVNWYEWYSKDSNKQRLKDSYSNLDYRITLDNSTIISIKEYNEKAENYLNWDGINSDGKSSFVNSYEDENIKFTCKDGTGDCS